jgi:hypothetical protein
MSASSTRFAIAALQVAPTLTPAFCAGALATVAFAPDSSTSVLCAPFVLGVIEAMRVEVVAAGFFAGFAVDCAAFAVDFAAFAVVFAAFAVVFAAFAAVDFAAAAFFAGFVAAFAVVFAAFAAVDFAAFAAGFFTDFFAAAVRGADFVPVFLRDAIVILAFRDGVARVPVPVVAAAFALG